MKALVLCGAPESGFAQPRKAEEYDFSGIDAAVSLQVIGDPSETPSADRAPFVGRGIRLTFGKVQRSNAVLYPSGKIGFNIAVVNGRKGVASSQDFVYLPLVGRFPG